MIRRQTKSTESNDTKLFRDPKKESIKSDDLVIKSDDFYVGKPRLKKCVRHKPKNLHSENVVAAKLVDVNFFSCRHGLPRVKGSEFFF